MTMLRKVALIAVCALMAIGAPCQAGGRKSLSVKKIECAELPAAEDVPEILDEAGVKFRKIGCVNWSSFSYRPSAEFRIAHTGNAILIQYRVSEESVRAVADKENGRVWEDSCVEFFVSPGCDDVYYNFEFNCIGRMHIAGGRKGESRPVAENSVLQKVRAWSSLGTEPFDSKTGGFSWTEAIVIPVEALYLNDLDSLDGKTMTGNFYKCGDKLPTPHYLSWSPIPLPSPQFHAPYYFGKLHFRR
jgi:hypothetical protein